MAVKLDEGKFDKKEFYLWLHYHDFLTKAIVITGAGVLLILIGIIPMVNRFYKSRQLLNKEKAKLEELSQKVTVADNLDQNILAERVNLLNQVLPPSKNVVIYLNTLANLAQELNLSLGDVSLSPGVIYESKEDKAKSKTKTNKEKWKLLETELRIIGNKESIYKFLKQVEKTAPLMVVKDVKMGRVGSKGDNESFILSLKLGMVYAQPEDNRQVKGEIKLLTKEDEQIIAKIRDFKTYPLGTDQAKGSQSTFSRDNLFEPGLKFRLTNQSGLPQEEKSQLQLQPSPESSESSQSSQLQNQTQK